MKLKFFGDKLGTSSAKYTKSILMVLALSELISNLEAATNTTLSSAEKNVKASSSSKISIFDDPLMLLLYVTILLTIASCVCVPALKDFAKGCGEVFASFRGGYNQIPDRYDVESGPRR